MIADIDHGRACETRELVRNLGVRASAYQVDVSDADAMRRFADAVFAEYGIPDIVLNNAGIGMAGPFLDTSELDWRRIIDVNLWGVINGCQVFGEAMVANGEGGKIVNTASAAAFLPSRALSAYATTKAAVLMLSRVPARRAGRRRYRGDRHLPRCCAHQHHRDHPVRRPGRRAAAASPAGRLRGVRQAQLHPGNAPPSRSSVRYGATPHSPRSPRRRTSGLAASWLTPALLRLSARWPAARCRSDGNP